MTILPLKCFCLSAVNPSSALHKPACSCHHLPSSRSRKPNTCTEPSKMGLSKSPHAAACLPTFQSLKSSFLPTLRPHTSPLLSLLHIPSFPQLYPPSTLAQPPSIHTQQVTTPTGPCLDKPATLSPQLLKNRIKIICLYIFNCTEWALKWILPSISYAYNSAIFAELNRNFFIFFPQRGYRMEKKLYHKTQNPHCNNQFLLTNRGSTNKTKNIPSS